VFVASSGQTICTIQSETASLTLILTSIRMTSPQVSKTVIAKSALTTEVSPAQLMELEPGLGLAPVVEGTVTFLPVVEGTETVFPVVAGVAFPVVAGATWFVVSLVGSFGVEVVDAGVPGK